MQPGINFSTGDTVKVHQKIQEGDKTRIQIFKGVVLGIKGRGINKMFTVQKNVGGISIERIWPIMSPNVVKVDVDAKPRKRVRKSKIYHLKFPKK